MFSTLPPQSSQGYGLSLGLGPGQQTQIFDMAASDRAFDVANRELDECLQGLYDAANDSINAEGEESYPKQEDARIMHQMMFMDVGQQNPT